MPGVTGKFSLGLQNAAGQRLIEFCQEKALVRANIDVLRISELKWIEMGKFNSDDHYIYYCGQESLRRNGVAIMVNRRVRNAVLG